MKEIEMKARHTRTFHKGQALSETGIIIGLISVVSISGLSYLSNAVQEVLQSQGSDLHSDELADLMVKPPVLSATPVGSGGNGAAGAGETSNSSGGAASGGSNSSGPPNGLSLQLGNGQYADLGNYPTDMSQSIETTGANGTTSLMLSTMDRIIQQALDSGNISQAEANRLWALSKQGHNIANLQQTMFDGIMAGKDNMSSIEIGYSPSKGTEDVEIVKFRQLLQQANTANPAVNQAVSVLVNQIVNISSGVENSAYHAQQSDTQWTAAQFNQDVINTMFERDKDLSINTKQTLLDLGGSVVSHQNSQQICQAGNGNTSNCTVSGK